MAPIHFTDPSRKRLKLRPFKAMGHFRKLVANKEDTEQVFHISECLPSKGFFEQAKAFCASAKGRALMVSEPYLPAVLDDHETLLKLPEGSVAHAYVAFMRREGLTAAGLVEESERVRRPTYGDQLEWYGKRTRDTHDLVHVLTGYGRDALGEQCALGFSYGQDRGWTALFLAWAGALEIRRRVKVDAPVFKAVGEAQRMGTAAQRIIEQDVRALLAEPLEAARARLGIQPTTQYTQAHTVYRSRGIDPYNFLAAAA
jgi:ubiquinone biosynthesis protein COQ4